MYLFDYYYLVLPRGSYISEKLFSMQAETLRDSFPPSDKSLSKLLGEAPRLPKSVLILLGCLCSPGISEKAEESQSGDRVTQGLSTVWSLILLRPPIRDVCLKIALQVCNLSWIILLS